MILYRTESPSTMVDFVGADRYIGLLTDQLDLMRFFDAIPKVFIQCSYAHLDPVLHSLPIFNKNRDSCVHHNLMQHVSAPAWTQVFA